MTNDNLYQRVTPLIVVGQPRSGTRFITNVLNRHEEVTIQGELASDVFRKFVDTFNVADKNNENEHWPDMKPALFFSIWKYLQKGTPKEPSDNCLFYGYKRPGHEKYFDFYENIFVKNSAKYIYCLRNFNDHFLSVKGRWPDRSIKNVSRAWLDSLAILGKMQASAPDRVFLFSLDLHVQMGPGYLQDLLTQVGVNTTRDKIEKLSDTVSRNDSKTKGYGRVEGLSQREIRFLRKKSIIQETYNEIINSTRSSIIEKYDDGILKSNVI